MPQNQAGRILAIDTSSPRGSLALLQGRSLVAELRLNSLETHSARLLRSLDFLLESARFPLESVGLVAASIGPGSFTGIRIGVATAVGIAQSLSIPFAGISGLDAAAHALPSLNGAVGIVMDAQRTQVYYAMYEIDGSKARRVGKPQLLSPVELGAHLRGRRMFLAGDGVRPYQKELGVSANSWPRIVDAELFLAAEIGRLAHTRKRLWRKGDFIVAEPLYIRPPDAIRPGARRRSAARS